MSLVGLSRLWPLVMKAAEVRSVDLSANAVGLHNVDNILGGFLGGLRILRHVIPNVDFQ
jgi:hypothetical protein